MKKRRKLKKKIQITQYKKIVALFFVIGIFISAIIGFNTLRERKEVSAHPTNKIKLDQGGANEFELPIDATQLREPSLIGLTPQYDDYVQKEGYVPILTKGYIEGSCITNGAPRRTDGTIKAIEKTNYGHYFVLYSFTGNTTGGLLKVGVYDENGKSLAEEAIGNATNTNYRVVSVFYHVEDNSFLVGLNNGGFFRYDVSGETATTATLTRTAMNRSGNPNSSMNVGLHFKVDVMGNYDDDSLIMGRISATGAPGRIAQRIPVATMNVSGWKNAINPGFSGTSVYQYSLENLRNTDAQIGFNYSGYAEISPMNIYSNQDHLFGEFYNAQTTPSTRRKNSFQVFSKTDEVSGGLKQRKYAYVTDKTLFVLNELCTDDKVYFMVLNDANTELIEVDLTTYVDKVIKTYPPQTRLKMIDNGDGTVSYFGSTTQLANDFYSDYYTPKLSGTNYFISGLMTDFADTTPLKITSLRAFVTNGNVLPTVVLNTGNNKLFVGGQTDDQNIFVDKTKYYLQGSANPATPSGSLAFVGAMETKDDYSPVINKEESIEVDVTDNAIASPTATTYRDWNTRDRWLITGSKNGDMSDAAAIKTFDNFDSNDISIGSTAQEREEWLQKRINRNPKDVTAAIEWDKLGFDATTTGPQLVTYFVSDTQNQPAVTSRWVNKTTPQTIIEDDYAFDAQNFHIPLAGIETSIPDEDKFKEFAKTMAWNMVDGTIDENGTGTLSSKVTVDTNQLELLQKAKIAKPYPVDVIYEPKIGVSIINRVWVFVTTKNTLPNNESIYTEVTPPETNGIVYYADDYGIPFRKRSGHTAQDVLEKGNIRVYDYYDSSHETDSELPVLADENTNSNKLQVINLTDIQNALQPEVIEFGIHSPKKPLIKYEWDGAVDANHQAGTTAPTYGGLDVTLTGDVILHVRQVIMNPSNEIVIPSKGYVRIQNQLDNSGSPILDPNYQNNITVTSGKQTNNPSFTNFSVSVNHLVDEQDQVLLSSIIPEFYNYAGYYLTDQTADPNGLSHATNSSITPSGISISIDTIQDKEEFWITVYLKPVEDDKGEAKVPQPYSWDYKKNDLGKIKTKTP